MWGPESWDKLGVIIFAVAALGWLYLHNKVTPGPVDLWDYITTRALEDPTAQAWLEMIDQDFIEMWGLDPATSLREVMEI